MIALDQGIGFESKPYDLLTVGELLIDMISADYGDNTAIAAYHRHFGGSPSNIAMNARRLGIRTLVAAAVGTDGFGQYLTGQLEAADIDTRCVQHVEEATSMVVVTKSTATPVPIFYRSADYRLAFTPELEEAVKQAKAVHFSCWPVSMPPARETIEKVIDTARRERTLIGFDPNYHPMIWQKGEDGAAYVKSIIGAADIVKPSEDDAERLFGKDSPENQVAKFVDLGAKLVVMTLGKDGALISNGRETLRMGSLARQVVDTTGAGDAFWSGLYASIVKGYTIREALTLGFAVSAYKLQFTGAVVALPALEELRRIYGIQEGI